MTVTDARSAAPTPPSWNHRRLDEPERRSVTESARSRGLSCQCGSTRFTVGDALEMGSIWPDENLGTHLVALTCTGCGAHEGIRIYDL